MREIKEIIIHCSATPEGKDYTVSDINRWHKEKGYDCIGYHYVIYRNGVIAEGRPVEKIGAHCVGHNQNSIGVCYIGGMSADMKNSKDTRTQEQKESLKVLIKSLKSKYPNATVHGHNEFSNKDCPSFSVKNEIMLKIY